MTLEKEVAIISKELKGDYHTSQLTFSAGEKVEKATTELEVIGNALQAFKDLQALEVTILIEQMKTSNPNQHAFTGAVKAYNTELTPALKIKKAMELMQEGYEEELAILRAKNAEQAQIIEEQKPQVAGYRLTMDSDGTYSMAETAKTLKLPYGNVTLFKNLRASGLLDKNNIPLQEYVNRCYFTVITKPVPIGESVVNKTVTRVTAKGLDYIAKKLGILKV